VHQSCMMKRLVALLHWQALAVPVLLEEFGTAPGDETGPSALEWFRRAEEVKNSLRSDVLGTGHPARFFGLHLRFINCRSHSHGDSRSGGGHVAESLHQSLSPGVY
jgi:hypothetical protein